MGYLKRIFASKDLLKKILFVVGLLFVYRFISHIPIPGPDPKLVKDFLSSNILGNNQVLSFLDIFSGGSISRFSIAMLAVGPYITASIITQLLTIVVPSFESLNKEGEQGRNKINQYSRLMAIPIALVEGFGMIRLLQSASSGANMTFLNNLSIWQWAVMLSSITAGTMILMWLGELITEKGIGNGISIIIFSGIIAKLPQTIGQTMQKLFIGDFEATELIKVVLIAGLTVLVISLIVFITEAMRKIPISYAKKIRGDKLYGGIDTFLPLKLNMSGVIPIIFASAFMNIPSFIGFLSTAKTQWIANASKFIQTTFAPTANAYGIALFVLVFTFTFFSTYIYFKPNEVAENLQKQGGFIPGIRPGTQTEKYLNFLINRITLWGAIFLSMIAVLPFLLKPITNDPNLVVGGTSMLIVVGVAIEIKSQLDAQLITRSYEEF
ncbi:MAG: preprotein translocase subunit SecY [bacterium]